MEPAPACARERNILTGLLAGAPGGASIRSEELSSSEFTSAVK